MQIMRADDDQERVPSPQSLWNVELDEAAVSMSLSPNQQLLAVGTADDAIAVLDWSSGEVKHTLTGHLGGTNGVQFLSGNSIVSVGEDGKAKLWNVACGSCTHEIPVDAEGAARMCAGSGHSVNHLTVAPDGKSFACAAGRLVTLCKLAGGPQQVSSKRVLGPMDSTVESLRFDRRGNLLATYNGGVSYWNFERKEEEKQELMLPYPGACLCGDVTPEMDYIVAGCHDATVHIYHFKEKRNKGVELQEMTCGGYDGKVTAVDFNPAGDRMASSGGDKNTVWNFSNSPTGSMPTLCVGHRAAITCQAWQPDGKGWLATGGMDGRVCVYDVDKRVKMRKGMPFFCPPGALAATDGDEVTALVFGRDGLLYTGHISGAVRKWELPETESSDEEEDEMEDEEMEDEDDDEEEDEDGGEEQEGQGTAAGQTGR